MTDGEKPEKTMFDRESAWRLLCEYTQSESLRKHALAVEACMRAYARKFHGAGSQAAAAAATAGADAVPETDMPADRGNHAEAEGKEVTRDDLSAQPFLNEE